MTQTNQTTETSARSNDKPVPTHIAKVQRRGWGKKTTFERVGVVFTNKKDGSLYLKLYGKQVIDSGIHIYELKDNKDAVADEPAPADDGEGANEEAGA